ncbi:50S ribosomal protein L21 [Candidatus Peregrinibacteria bacterium CG_4_10_14_0_2_um_filter_38_24]|nr:MAG: 50S ribosomal protein L21 [Candidatus Peregrinibacteria bacterium CG_4_10_14_0_2_um_filter_38_24]
MFAIIETGGKQYKIEKGSVLEIEKLELNAEDKIEIDKVVLIVDGDDVKMGTPYLEGAFAEVKVLEQTKADKIYVYKMKAKKRYQKKQGHRQKLTKVEVLSISASGAKPVEKKVKEEVVIAKKPKAEKKPKTEKKTTVKKATTKKTTSEEKEA